MSTSTPIKNIRTEFTSTVLHYKKELADLQKSYAVLRKENIVLTHRLSELEKDASWVASSDRTPEVSGTYLVIHTNRNIYTLFRSVEYSRWGEAPGIKDSDILYWKTLSKTPFGFDTVRSREKEILNKDLLVESKLLSFESSLDLSRQREKTLSAELERIKKENTWTSLKKSLPPSSGEYDLTVIRPTITNELTLSEAVIAEYAENFRSFRWRTPWAGKTGILLAFKSDDFVVFSEHPPCRYERGEKTFMRAVAWKPRPAPYMYTDKDKSF